MSYLVTSKLIVEGSAKQSGCIGVSHPASTGLILKQSGGYHTLKSQCCRDLWRAEGLTY